MPAPARTYHYYYDNTVTAAVYARKGGVWTKIQSYPVNLSYGPYNSGGTRTFNWGVDDTFQLGSGVEAFGVSVESMGSGSGFVTYFSHAIWQAQGSTGGSRSATPNGEQSTATIRPI